MNDSMNDLSWEQVVALLPFTECFDKDNPWEAAQFYRDPAWSVMGVGGAWLEDGIVAGHIPHFGSIGLALRATQVVAIEELRQARQNPAEASSWPGPTAGSYRSDYLDMIELLEGFVAELEQQP